MKLTERIYMIGSGTLGGYDLSHPLDCNVFLIDGKSELAVIDAGAGLGVDEMLNRVHAMRLDPKLIRYLLLTHKHGDHAGGAAAWKRACDLQVMISHEAADILRSGDEKAISLDVGKRAGTYPDTYVFEPCPVDRELQDGDEIQVGDLVLRAIETPGHCDGHLSFWTEIDGQACLFAGDALFHGGRIVLQNIPDCTLEGHRKSIEKLGTYPVDFFAAGHGMFSLNQGKRHIDLALKAFEAGGIPPLYG